MRYILFTIALFSFPVMAQEWTIQNPPLPGETLNDVVLMDTVTAIAVGTSGIIYRTSDYGSTWNTTRNLLGVVDNFNAITSVNSFAWVVGNSGKIVYTGNSGDSWELLESGLSVDLFDVFFIDSLFGWAAGDSGTIIHTSDGGLTWELQPTNINRPIKALFFLSPSLGWGVGRFPNILKTIDGGVNWEVADPGHSYGYTDVYFINDSLGWITTRNQCVDATCGNICFTLDGGSSWTEIFGPFGPFLKQIGFSNELNSWALHYWYNGWGGNGGTDIFITDDGWNTYATHLELMEEYLNSVNYKEEKGISVGNAGLSFRLNVNEQKWERLSYTAPLNSVYFIDAQQGWAAGERGMVLHTNDGGISWEFQQTDTLVQYNDVQFVNADVGWVVGQKGTIMKTENGGNGWINQYSGEGLYFTSISVIDAQTGWITGSYPNPIEHYGRILQTIDGGDSWIKIDSLLNIQLTDIVFTDQNHGWVIGNYYKLDDHDWYGVISRTVDSGDAWNRDTLDFESYLSSITFVDSITGWIAGIDRESTISPYEGIVLKTEDGGITWTEQFRQNRVIPSDIQFVDQSHGWFTNAWSNSSFFATNDGGDSWSEQSLGETEALNSLYFLNDTLGWLVGESGLIIRAGDSVTSSIVVDESLMPDRFALYQNYPNPFNPVTTIRYALPIQTEVKLSIYNIMGQEVAVLMEKIQNAGSHAVKWNASNEPSGIYFYRLETTRKQFTKKLVVLK
jgi:photosystem II stability/assembly factor-like uncharacterized protein